MIVSSVDLLTHREALRRRGEAVLLEHAGSLDATALATSGRHLVYVVDPDREERRLEAQLDRDERAAHHARFLHVVEDGAGGVRVKGRGSVEDGAVLRAALLPLTCPAPAVDEKTGDEMADPRDHGARLWDALVATAQHALDTELPPETHGARPRVIVTVAHVDLLRGLREAVTDDGLRASAAAVRRMACDADVIPAVLGTSSEVLDVGRRHRLVTVAIWVALVLRGRHCTFAGCTRPPVMCHAHHLGHWILGGKTSLENLVLLCGHHHRVIHATPWEIRLNSHDGRPEFRAPPKRGRYPTWIRHRPRLE